MNLDMGCWKLEKNGYRVSIGKMSIDMKISPIHTTPTLYQSYQYPPNIRLISDPYRLIPTQSMTHMRPQINLIEVRFKLVELHPIMLIDISKPIMT